MHRNFQISVPADETDQLVKRLVGVSGVISLSVQHGDSVKPPGDVISAAVLNTAADEVLSLLEACREPWSVSTSSLDSLIDTDSAETVRSDRDEATWEEAETALRRHTRVTSNFALTTFGGGVVAACALCDGSSHVTEAVGLVAAAVIAPAFEPLARTVLSVVSRHRRQTLTGAGSALASYVLLIVAAVLTMLVLRLAGPDAVAAFHHSSTVHEVEHPSTLNLIVSAAGAVTGIVMIAAGRFTSLVGPLIALQLIPAAATIGIALELGETATAADGLARLAIDLGMVLLAGLIVFSIKQLTMHSGRHARH